MGIGKGGDREDNLPAGRLEIAAAPGVSRSGRVGPLTMASARTGWLSPFIPALCIPLAVLIIRAWSPGVLTVCDDALLSSLQRALRPFAADSVVAVRSRGTGELPELISRISREKPSAIVVVDCIEDGAAAVCAMAMEGAGNVIAAYTLCDGAECPPARVDAVIRSRFSYITNPWGQARRTGVPAVTSVRCADDSILAAASGCGFLEPGHSSAMPLVARIGEGFYHSADIAAIARSGNARRAILRLSGGSVQGISVDDRFFPTDPRGGIRLRQCGAVPPRASEEVLRGGGPPGIFSNRIVCVGGGGEAEWHAAAIAQLQAGVYLRESRRTRYLEIILIFILPAFVGGAPRRAAAAMAALVIAIAVALAFLLCGREIFSPLYPALGALCAVFWPRGK
ncbi:MAG: hypothetical protein NT045_04415 [Candidatus Aureabacteria bacterium]|nr:hypothetical protein [Candidatus Auribacterota bacterium]